MLDPTPSHDGTAYVSAVVSVAFAAANKLEWLQYANEIVTLIGGIIGIASGVLGLIYFVRNGRRKRRDK